MATSSPFGWSWSLDFQYSSISLSSFASFLAASVVFPFMYASSSESKSSIDFFWGLGFAAARGFCGFCGFCCFWPLLGLISPLLEDLGSGLAAAVIRSAKDTAFSTTKVFPIAFLPSYFDTAKPLLRALLLWKQT